jgi:hypothetical protein
MSVPAPPKQTLKHTYQLDLVKGLFYNEYSG